MKHSFVWKHLKYGIYKITPVEADTEEYLNMKENIILNKMI